MEKIIEDGEKTYPAIFTPCKIGPVILQNRVFFPPMSFNWANSDGTISDKLADFYIDLADGGCGLIYMGPAAVSHDSRLYEYMVRIYQENHVPGLKSLCAEIKKRGAVPALQLVNFGRQSISTFTGKELYAPSAIPCPVNTKFDPEYKVREMTHEDIERVTNDFLIATILAVEAGVEVIQLQAGHGYLLNQFLSPYTNHRSDEYGGAVENRARFLVNIITKIKEHFKETVALDVRVSADELIRGGLEPGDFREIIPLLEKAGCDMLNVSAGISYAYLRQPLISFAQRQPHGYSVIFYALLFLLLATAAAATIDLGLRFLQRRKNPLAP